MGYLGNEPADVAVTVGQGVIDASHIQDSSITTADLGNDAVTPNKLDDDGTGFQMGSLGLNSSVIGSDKFTLGGNATLKGDGSDQTLKWHNGSAYVNAKLDVRQLAISFSGTDKVTSDTSGNFNFSSNITINKGGALFNLQEPSGSQAYLYSGGSFTAFRTTSNHPIHITANYSSSDKATFGTDGSLTLTGAVTATGSDYMIKSVSTSTTNGDAIRISAESGVAQGKIELDWFNDSSQTGGGYGMIQVGKTSNSPELRIGASAVRIGSQQGSHELKVNRSRMRHIDGVADANADFSHGDLYVNHISTGNIYMQRDTTFAGGVTLSGGNLFKKHSNGNNMFSVANAGSSTEDAKKGYLALYDDGTVLTQMYSGQIIQRNKSATNHLVRTGFHGKTLTTSYADVFGFITQNDHEGIYYEIIITGGDWGSHSAHRGRFTGFINGHDGYNGHYPIDNHQAWGSTQLNVTWSGSTNNRTAKLQMKITRASGSADSPAKIYYKFVGRQVDFFTY